MTLSDSLTSLLESPTPDALWRLRGDVLIAGAPANHPALVAIDALHELLTHLGAGASARELSHRASKLDIAAVGAVAMESVMGDSDSGNQWRRLVLAALSEGLMVLASRQYVKAAEAEMEAVYQDMAWFLYEQYWRLSASNKPEVEPVARSQELADLVAPLRDPDTDPTLKVVTAAALLQLLIVVQLGALTQSSLPASGPTA